MKIFLAEYMASAVAAKQYPNSHLPEIAFAGRSNVGKSSLINTLLNRKNLVKTSNTPGKTQTINFFNVNDHLIFADLPGYGFARVPEKIKKTWRIMVERYLLNRQTLKSVVFIIDIRRNPTEWDLKMKSWLEENGIDYILVATKTDKVTKKERKDKLNKISEAFLQDKDIVLIPFSSKKKEGRKNLWNEILKKINAGNDL
ncbi:MAG: YihA family ribosome biogenesis GTP-binding protein [Nitrospinae bacterium]|nr:YihA family ribosome biogenesis GTP-binding protein [Nitrospinota bacterium]